MIFHTYLHISRNVKYETDFVHLFRKCLKIQASQNNINYQTLLCDFQIRLLLRHI